MEGHKETDGEFSSAKPYKQSSWLMNAPKMPSLSRCFRCFLDPCGFFGSRKSFRFNLCELKMNLRNVVLTPVAITRSRNGSWAKTSSKSSGMFKRESTGAAYRGLDDLSMTANLAFREWPVMMIVMRSWDQRRCSGEFLDMCGRCECGRVTKPRALALARGVEGATH